MQHSGPAESKRRTIGELRMGLKPQPPDLNAKTLRKLIGRRGARAQLDDADGVSPDARHHQRDFDSNHAFVKMASSNVLRSTSCSTMVVLLPVSTSS